MNRPLYLTGGCPPEEEAKVSIFDRGFVMADAVFEGISVLEGKLIDFAGHAGRSARSLGELGMAQPKSEAELLAIHRELVARNRVEAAGLSPDHPRHARRPGQRPAPS